MSDVVIRAAREDEANAIYQLKREGFGESYLDLTIYRSPKSMAYIRRLIAEGQQTMLVAERSGELLGYANVAYPKTGPMLNYIATSLRGRSGGVGNLLLASAEGQARLRGWKVMSLDSFQGNEMVSEWYERHGYQDVVRSYLYSFEIEKLPANGDPLRLQQDAFREALASEICDGFSKIDGKNKSGELTVGLIAGNTCKLLSFTSMAQSSAIAAITATFPERQKLIVPSANELGENWSATRVETVLRMTKEL